MDAIHAYHYRVTPTADLLLRIAQSGHGTAIPFRGGGTDTVCAIVVVHGGEPQQGYSSGRARVRGWHFGMDVPTRETKGHVSEIGVVCVCAF